MAKVLPEVEIYQDAIDSGDYVDPFDEDLRSREHFATTHPVIFTPKRLELKHDVDVNDEKFKEAMKKVEEDRQNAAKLIAEAENQVVDAEEKRAKILGEIKHAEKALGYSRTNQKKKKTKKAQAAPAGGPEPEVTVKEGDTRTLKELRGKLAINEQLIESRRENLRTQDQLRRDVEKALKKTEENAKKVYKYEDDAEKIQESINETIGNTEAIGRKLGETIQSVENVETGLEGIYEKHKKLKDTVKDLATLREEDKRAAKAAENLRIRLDRDIELARLKQAFFLNPKVDPQTGKPLKKDSKRYKILVLNLGNPEKDKLPVNYIRNLANAQRKLHLYGEADITRTGKKLSPLEEGRLQLIADKLKEGRKDYAQLKNKLTTKIGPYRFPHY